jgi:predicted signal transduction protein with EAL and GGDEF domain
LTGGSLVAAVAMTALGQYPAGAWPASGDKAVVLTPIDPDDVTSLLKGDAQVSERPAAGSTAQDQLHDGPSGAARTYVLEGAPGPSTQPIGGALPGTHLYSITCGGISSGFVWLARGGEVTPTNATQLAARAYRELASGGPTMRVPPAPRLYWLVRVPTWLRPRRLWAPRALADLLLAVLSVIAMIAAPRLLVAAAVAGLVLHVGYRGAAVAKAERRAAQRLLVAVTTISDGDQDVPSIAARAVEQAAKLVGADTVELVLQDHPLVARFTRSGHLWIGHAASGDSTGEYVAEVMPVGGDAGTSVGELRVFFARPTRLGDRERSALTALTSALGSVLRTAAAQAELASTAMAAEHAASHNTTTQLPGQPLLLAWINQHLEQARPTNPDRPVALICINIRGWPEIADELAGPVSDRLLAAAGQRLLAGATQSERVAHLGGDTFAAWIPAAATIEHVLERADSLLAMLNAPAVAGPGPVVLAGIAGLVYATPSTTPSAEELLRQARAALRTGHRLEQTVTVYRSEEDNHSQSAIVIGSELHTALRRDQLELDYQPVLELATARPLAVVAHPHWLHPTRGRLPAHEWMPILEQSEIVGAYVRWMLDQALAAHSAWSQHDTKAPVTVLLPSAALLNPALPATVTTALANANAAPSDLTIQLTGNWVLGSSDVTDGVLVDLASRGIGLAVDIAGLSLEQLSRVPASEIKLSGYTTRLALSDQETRAKIKAIVAFADELGLNVTAEDIPTVEHVAALIELRVHAGQGPRLSPHWNAKEVPEALRQAFVQATETTDARIITFPCSDR